MEVLNLEPTLAKKYELLKKNLRELGAVAVAYSGGVDSSFLLAVAKEVCEKVVALTASSVFVPARELIAAKKFCAERTTIQFIFEADVLNVEGIRENPINRCYLCKRALFTNLSRFAAEQGCVLIEGTNADDAKDFRPGLKALAELSVRSPLRDADLHKVEIRELSRALNLPTADKPSMACLASRFVFGERLTTENLAKVEAAENFLLDLGFRQLRVRNHGNLARIEILPEDFSKLLELRTSIVEKLSSLGFDYVSLDLLGFRSGSMNLSTAN